MSFQKEYNQLISKAINENRLKGQGTYYESHHWLPQSIFPQYEKCKWNKVLLTATEHFDAHYYLCGFYEKNQLEHYKMLSAFNQMCGRRKDDTKKFNKSELKIHYQRQRPLYEKLKKDFYEKHGEMLKGEKSPDWISLTKSQQKEIIKLYKNNTNIFDIANIFNISKETIKRRLKQWEVWNLNKVFTNEEKRKIKIMRSEGEFYHDIASMFDVSRQTIKRLLGNYS